MSGRNFKLRESYTGSSLGLWRPFALKYRYHLVTFHNLTILNELFPLKQLGNVEDIWSSMIIDTLKVAGPRDNLHGLYCAADKVPSRL